MLFYVDTCGIRFFADRLEESVFRKILEVNDASIVVSEYVLIELMRQPDSKKYVDFLKSENARLITITDWVEGSATIEDCDFDSRAKSVENDTGYNDSIDGLISTYLGPFFTGGHIQPPEFEETPKERQAMLQSFAEMRDLRLEISGAISQVRPGDRVCDVLEKIGIPKSKIEGYINENGPFQQVRYLAAICAMFGLFSKNKNVRRSPENFSRNEFFDINHLIFGFLCKGIISGDVALVRRARLIANELNADIPVLLVTRS